MMIKTAKAEQFTFLAGGGEMGRLMRAKNWAESSIGSPENWPQSLCTTLGIVLNSKFPMFLWWGPDLICFYNDAYRPSLGENGKHPDILGLRAEEAWPEIWDIIKPLIDQVLSGGEATWSEDQLIPIYRNGKLEDVYWTFSYSPVHDETGNVGGVLVTCSETTEKVKVLNDLKEREDQLSFTIHAAELGTWDHDPATNRIVGNDRLKEWFGFDSTKEIELQLALERIHEKDRQRVIDAIQASLQPGSGGHYEIEYTIAHPATGAERRVLAKGKALFNEQHIATRFSGTLQDITQQVETLNKLKADDERLNVIITASELGTFELNVRTRDVKYSDRYLQILGYPERVELTHDVIIKHLHPEDLPSREKAFQDAFKKGHLHHETRIIWNDGTIHWIQAKGKVFYDEQHEPLLLMGTIRDITAEKNYQKELQDREEKFRVLADSMPQFVWTSGAGGQLNYFNQSLYRYTGLTPEKIEEEGWLQIVHPDEREENMKKWMEAVETGTDFLFEHRFRRQDGEYRWQLSRAIPQRDANGNIRMWVGTSTDIQEIKELDQQKDYFISMASHELKTPITSIKGYVQVMLSKYGEGSDPFLVGSLAVVDKQIVTLTNLVTDLLDLSKIKSGSLVLGSECFPVNELIREVIDELEHINPDYEFVFSGDSSVAIRADRERIGQVLRNLFTNAVKYSPLNRRVNVKSTRKNDQVEITVEDFGIGISKSNQEKIFERFYRVEGKNEKTFPGFGIGLFIASEIIFRHGGQIGVNSEPGKGSVFYFTLPVEEQ